MSQNEPPNIDLVRTADELLRALDARSKDILTRRYGLKNGKVETLESIGKEYGITRERVRQIQSQAKKTMLTIADILKPVAGLMERVFGEHGGILSEEHAVRAVQDSFQTNKPNASLVLMFLDILTPYKYVVRHTHFGPHWRHPDLAHPQAEAIIEAAQEILQTAGHPVASDRMINQLYDKMPTAKEKNPPQHVEAFLTASQAIQQTPFGEWGLVMWAETNPRGVGDKAYAVLRRHEQPEHFTRIAELINESRFDSKQANPQTVHNELIKDKRFILVGRGLYGLAEWGYIPGTVADVIESLLSQAGEPLTREEVIKQVMAQRQVKKNTILLGLQNQKRFVKTPENRYTTRQR